MDVHQSVTKKVFISLSFSLRSHRGLSWLFRSTPWISPSEFPRRPWKAATTCQWRIVLAPQKPRQLAAPACINVINVLPFAPLWESKMTCWNTLLCTKWSSLILLMLQNSSPFPLVHAPHWLLRLQGQSWFPWAKSDGLYARNVCPWRGSQNVSSPNQSLLRTLAMI